MLNFDDLKPEVIQAQITTSYGKVISIPLLTLSWEQWEAIGREVPDPEIPRTKLAPSGKPEDMLPNPYDALYLKQKADAADERLVRRLIAALEGGGTVIPGASIAERVASVKAMDGGLFQALIGILSRAFMSAQSRVETRAESFRTSALIPIEAENVSALEDRA